MKKMELFNLVNGGDQEYTQKYIDFMNNQASDEIKLAIQEHSAAFNQFVSKAVSKFLEKNKNLNLTEEELYARLNEDETLQEEYKQFVQTSFTSEELADFQTHAIEMNDIVLDLVDEFAKFENIDLED